MGKHRRISSGPRFRTRFDGGFAPAAAFNAAQCDINLLASGVEGFMSDEILRRLQNKATKSRLVNRYEMWALSQRLPTDWQNKTFAFLGHGWVYLFSWDAVRRRWFGSRIRSHETCLSDLYMLTH